MSLNQAELIMLYEMVTNTAQNVVDNYRSYKKNVQHMSRATTDLEELRNMAGLAAKTPSQELEMQYTLRKAQRDVDSLVDDVHRYRQNLIDLAGREAVDKLDNLMNDEMQKLENTQIAPSLKSKPNM
jgi:chorismate synthase